MRSLRTVRGRLTALAMLAAALAIAVLTLVFNVLLDRTLSGDANSRLRSQAAAAATTVTHRGSRLHVLESPNDAAIDRQVWIFDGRRALVRPLDGPELQAAADALAGRAHVFTDLPAREVRMYAAPITSHGRQVGTVVAAESLTAYDRTTDLALVGSLALAAVLLAAVFVVTRVVIGRALGPVRDMTRQAAAWSEHDLAGRFGASPRPDELGELGELAQTFDDLLDRVAASVRHEQRFSAELSHELRTPLSRIVAETELLRRRDRPVDERGEAYASIARSAEQMSQILETLMAAARADAQLSPGRSELRGALSSVADAWAHTPRRPDVELDVSPVPDALVAGVDAQLIERIVAPLLDNAARFARSRIVLSAARAPGGVQISVADDGPGIPPDERERIFEAGVRLDADHGHDGAGLGLALVRRLARAASGDVTVAERPEGQGAEFRIALPS
jgi:signal transduction histidine kinase